MSPGTLPRPAGHHERQPPFDSAAHRWLVANAPRYGWVHPAWAEAGGSLPEPWHWEFAG